MWTNGTVTLQIGAAINLLIICRIKTHRTKQDGDNFHL